MRKIVYYVAMSLDAYICGPNEDVSGFVQDGNGVEKYLKDLEAYDTVIMGRKTYEFGYAFGLQPGQPAYPHMNHYIFSKQLSFDNAHEKIHICELDLSIIKDLKAQEGTDIYLCGGGELANWLLEKEQIDIVKVKLNPFIQGNGVRIFGNATKVYQLNLKENETYDNGLLMLTYEVKY